MTIKGLEYLERVLLRCTPVDAKLEKAIALVRKDLACYKARKGQLRENYEVDLHALDL